MSVSAPQTFGDPSGPSPIGVYSQVQPATAIDALRRWGGMYGQAYRDGYLLQEAIEVSGNVAVARVEVPLVGATRMGYKAGRETREGTMRIQQIDSTWAIQVYQFTSQSLATRIANRGTSNGGLPTFDLFLSINDPEAYDYEAWNLYSVQCWQMPVGFAITDDIVQREIPITWESEVPAHAFVVDRSASTPAPIAVYDNGTLDNPDFVLTGRY